MTTSARTKRMFEIYRRYQKTCSGNEACFLCSEKGLKDFKYWKILKNNFPWDRVAKTHHMIVPKRHVSVYKKLNQKEKDELEKIKESYLDGVYSAITEVTFSGRSVSGHFHLHLINWKW